MLILLTSLRPVFADGELEAARNEVQLTAAAYDSARSRYDEILSDIDANEKRLEELQDKLPKLQEDAGSVIHAAYKMGKETPNLLSLILSSDNLSDFLSTMYHLENTQARYMKTIKELNEVQDELNEKSKTLETQKEEAQKTLHEAEAALAAATNARMEAQRQIEAQIEREKAEAEAAIAAAKEASGSTFTPTNPETKTEVEVPTKPSTGPVDWSVGRDAFVNTWSSRINSYLSGSPMAGTGQAFAEAAWNSGVDPRWSPAIAMAESTKGAYVPYGNSNNAWGWTAVGGGFRRFGSFDEGARQHVAYLGRVYGPTVTPSAAKKYVGTAHWSYWYSKVVAQMERM